MIYSLGTWFLSPNGRQHHTMWLFKPIYVPTAWVIVHTHTHTDINISGLSFCRGPFQSFSLVTLSSAAWRHGASYVNGIFSLNPWILTIMSLQKNLKKTSHFCPLAGLCDSSKGCAGAAMCGAIFKLTRLEGNRAGFCYPLPSWWNTVFIQFSHPRNYPSSEVLFMFSADTGELFLYITGTVTANKRRITMYKK